jgi:hypothetical protein
MRGDGASWARDERAELPEPWPPPGERRRTSDGSELALRTRALEVDPLDQTLTLEIRAERWREGDVVAEEQHPISLRAYFRDELLLMLERAGFREIEVRGGYADDEPTADHDFLVFVARA